MRKSLLLALAIVMSASLAFAQGGAIVCYQDPGGTICSGAPAVGVGNLYVFHEGIPAANASQFVTNIDPGIIAFYTGYSTAPYLNIPSQPLAGFPNDGPPGGISIAYGNPLCEPLPANILRLGFFFTAFPQCSYVDIVPDPLASIPAIEVRDCANAAVPAVGGSWYFDNGAGGCPTCGAVVPVEKQTWGQIKSLYN